MLRRVRDTHFMVDRQWGDDFRKRAELRNAEAERWLERFDQLGELLLIYGREGHLPVWQRC